MTFIDSVVAVTLVASAATACVVFGKKPEPEFKSGFQSKYEPMPERRCITGAGLMNGKQRKAMIIALVIAGATLMHVMAHVEYDTRYYDFFIYSWADSQGIRGMKYLYLGHGVPGVLIGLLVPLCLWAGAAYIALGSRMSNTQSSNIEKGSSR